MTFISRQTKQKYLILEQIEKMPDFFTAEELFKKLKEKDKYLGIATVYRSLKNLVHKEKIHSYLCEKHTIYSRSKKSHCHFICENCGRVTHLTLRR